MVRLIFQQIIQIVDQVHFKGFAHRDLKLQNILVNRNGEIRLIDFGLTSKLSGSLGNGYFAGTENFGTKNYMAPEIIIGAPYKGKQVDTFALGVILFQLIFLCDPFKKARLNNKEYIALQKNCND